MEKWKHKCSSEIAETIAMSLLSMINGVSHAYEVIHIDKYVSSESKKMVLEKKRKEKKRNEERREKYVTFEVDWSSEEMERGDTSDI